MEVSNELKQKIVEALNVSRENFGGSDAKFAISLDISAAQLSRIRKGDIERVLSDAKWIGIARRIGVNMGSKPHWYVVETPVFSYITAQLEACRQESVSALLCDLSDIGKTFTAVSYCKTHRNAIYVDCSQVKSRQRLIRYIAKEFGVESSGRYADVYADLVYYIKTLNTPLIILDEAGDLQYEAFLEIKALWNATELACGFYMMGADGLREKIRRAIEGKKVGYTELFSRFGRRYGSVVPQGKEDGGHFMQQSAAMIIKANAPYGTDVGQVLRRTMGEDQTPSLRRIYKELSKLNVEK